MKKFLILCAFPLLFLAGCNKFDLTDYHLVGEKWLYELNDIGYYFEFTAIKNSDVYLTIFRDNEFVRNEERDEIIYLYSKSDSFDYVLVNGEKANEELVPFVFPIGVYEVGSNDKASFAVHCSLKNFQGYLYSKPELQPCSSEPMHVIRISLH